MLTKLRIPTFGKQLCTASNVETKSELGKYIELRPAQLDYQPEAEKGARGVVTDDLWRL